MILLKVVFLQNKQHPTTSRQKAEEKRGRGAKGTRCSRWRDAGIAKYVTKR
jgi:hypothetical protein